MAQHVLMIEDDERLAGMVAAYLAPHGFEVRQGGADFALILLDLMLPDADGLEVFRQIRTLAAPLRSLAAVAWAWAMLREGGLTRKLGVIGLVSGALPAVAVVAAGQAMTATVVVGTLLVQGIWNLTAATYLLRGAQPAPISNPAPERISARISLTG